MDYITGYLGKDNQLTDREGKVLGTYEITKSWVALGYTRRYQVYAEVDGITYTGRSEGTGALFKGERVKG